MNNIDYIPFVHYIHDDIPLPSSLFEKTLEIADTMHNAKDVRTMGPIEKNYFYNENVEYIKEINEFANKKLWSVYKKLYPLTENLHYPNELIKVKHAVWTPTINKTAPGIYHDSIHTDAFWKIMTTVYYITEIGTGTPLYNSQKEFIKYIPWKQGRGYSFLPHKNSYHNYGNNLENNRITLIINMTTIKHFKKTKGS